MEKYVYLFEEGNKDLKMLLGGKGANLSEMTNLGIPVPPGFTISTEACDQYNKIGKKFPNGMMDQVKAALEKTEKKMGKKFGDEKDPLLFSVRSGAASSMPGMMDTVLNLGLNEKTVEAIIKKTTNPRFAYDAYRRFIQMFGNVVMKVEHHQFEKILNNIKSTKGAEYDTDLTAEDLKLVIEKYKELIKKETKQEFPNDPFEQLNLAIHAVFNSWMNPRAIAYRKIHEIKGLIGTAVNIQVMVFGNMGNTSGTGVCFTRNPSTGEKDIYGEFLMNAQGEDVVAGIRTPQPLKELNKVMPKCYSELISHLNNLESHYKDMQDVEFTIQEGKLYILQTRNGKRTAHAAVRIAVEMVGEKIIDKKTALLRVEPNSLNQLLHKQFDPLAKKKAKTIAKGLPASPGAAVGEIVFTAEDAEKGKEKGTKVILVRAETNPDDIKGMAAAQGILTSRGGMTSHAAVVARGMGKCCIVGCGDLIIDEHEKIMRVKDETFKEGDVISMDGSTGEVMKGTIPSVDPELKGEFRTLMVWTDEFKKLGVLTNADTPHDSQVARDFGAQGIGLCRTEHMFFEGDRIKAMREMILSSTLEGRQKALRKLEPMQRGDFEGIFKIMHGLPVTIRLLDPPLHEFLPTKEDEIKELSKEMGVEVKALKEKAESLRELNPMLGHRGCRLGMTYPEITEMQTRAIIDAACNVKKSTSKEVFPEIMVPLVGHVNELKVQHNLIKKVADETIKKHGITLKYKIGTMIEVPRGALTADEVAEFAEFFSFGTNDLTQMAFGFSRDDIAKFLPEYLENEILPKDPFVSIDRNGVGQLMQIAVEKGRKTKKDLKIGICGEHGGDPESVEFCHMIKLNYVSCSPFRVPIARLAAAHAAINHD